MLLHIGAKNGCKNFCKVRYFSSTVLGPWNRLDKIENPLTLLDSVLEQPMFSKMDHIIFNPSIEEVKQAQTLFKSLVANRLTSINEVVDLSNLPKHNLLEVIYSIFLWSIKYNVSY